MGILLGFYVVSSWGVIWFRCWVLFVVPTWVSFGIYLGSIWSPCGVYVVSFGLLCGFDVASMWLQCCLNFVLILLGFGFYFGSELGFTCVNAGFYVGSILGFVRVLFWL